ncbi:putative ATPase/DNA-binding winged helix-turn-helix (wHTH) protein [Bradyrhizobium sp. AZCC 2262]
MYDTVVHRKLRFGPFELSIGERMLRRDNEVLPLGGRALDILIYLADRPGEVIAKQELIDHVWPDVTVEEGSLRVHIAAVRKALADGQFGNRYIANVKARGYSFVGTVVPLAGSTESRNDRPRLQGRLAARPPVMIDRESVLSEVKDNLRVKRFVTLLGPGGIGKTTIAVAAGHAIAEEFGGEVYFVDLGNLADPDLVVRTVGTSLGLALKSNDESIELVDLIRSRRLLIILDNCEHVIKATALLAEQLFQEVEQVHLLTTSRELLRVEGEHCCRIFPLDFPPAGSEQTADVVLCYPAVQLFVERVKARGSNFVLTDSEAPFVAEMCRRLDGIPLAIELAAGPVAAFGVRSTVARLVFRLELLKFGHRTAVPRHQTLKATLDWSYDLLPDMERIVFRRIARFVDHFGLEGARYVAGEQGSDHGEICDAIAGLVEKSLIAVQLDQGEPQYRLLDTTRAYALGKLEEHGEFDAISRRHAEYVAQQLQSQREMLSALPRAERVAAYSGQLSNVRLALEWSFGPRGYEEIATRLAVASTQLFMELSLLIEWQSWAEQGIARLEDKHKNSRALDVALMQQDLAREFRLLSGLFLFSSWTTDIHRALDVAAQSQKVALTIQDPDDMAHAETMLGAANHLAGNHLLAQKHFEAGLRHAVSGSRLHAARYLFHHTTLLLAGMARSLLYRGVLDQSLDYARLAIEEGEKSELSATLCRSLILVLPVYLALEDWQKSEQYIVQLTDVSATHSLNPLRSIATGLRGRWLLLQGDIRDGVLLLKRASEELETQRHEMLNMDFVSDLGEGLAALGQHEEALTLVMKALDVQKRGGKLLFVPALLRVKGLILASRSAEDYPDAERSLMSSIEWSRRQSANLFELKSAIDLAELLLSQKRMPEAYGHISAALDQTSDEIVSPVHDRARQILSRLQPGTRAAG